MTNNISASAANRRESSRASDGKFGHQYHSEADISLGGDDEAAAQRRRLEFFTSDQDNQWHQDFINDDIPTLREVAHYGWQVNDPYDLQSLNERFKTIDLHMFYDDRADPYDAVHDNSELTPQLWMADKDGQNWAKVSNQQLLDGINDHEEPDNAYSAYAAPESFFAPDARSQPKLNKYDYFDGDYDFIDVIPPEGVDDLVTAYDDPKSPLNCVHPPGESEVGLLPDKGPGEFEDAEIAIANAMHAKGASTFVEYGTTNPFEEPGSDHYDPHANQSIVHFYRTDDAGNERHFATGHTKGRLADPNVYGAQVMRTSSACCSAVRRRAAYKVGRETSKCRSYRGTAGTSQHRFIQCHQQIGRARQIKWGCVMLFVVGSFGFLDHEPTTRRFGTAQVILPWRSSCI